MPKLSQMTDEEYAEWYARTGGRIRPISEEERERRRQRALKQWSDPETRRAHRDRMRKAKARIDSET